ncbi:MAG: hypothetical protein EHM89_11800 [Acidobacteria bacterium]|nr:MAG: hypothetical protein EHM89_11800 [Acidobacteriota bacterium]
MSLPSLRRPGTRLIAGVALGAVLLLQAPWMASGKTAGQPATVAVNCEPNQQAIVRQTIVNGETHVNIQCVGAGGPQPVVYTDQYGRPLPVMPTGAVAPTQAVYVPQQAYAPAPTYATQPVYAPQPVARSTVASQRRVVSERVPEKKRSWQKAALLIGGSAGTGAGVGGLVAGKKGALVGAAIGGGAASIYEGVKR